MSDLPPLAGQSFGGRCSNPLSNSGCVNLKYKAVKLTWRDRQDGKQLNAEASKRQANQATLRNREKGSWYFREEKDGQCRQSSKSRLKCLIVFIFGDAEICYILMNNV
jgi:hypothetical protein